MSENSNVTLNLAQGILYAKDDIINKIKEVECYIEQSRLTNGVESFLYNNGKLDGLKEAYDILDKYISTACYNGVKEN